MLELREVTVSYGMIDALKGISLNVKQGEIVALIGANGAGKSTTLMSIRVLLPCVPAVLFMKAKRHPPSRPMRSSGWEYLRSRKAGAYSPG